MPQKLLQAAALLGMGPKDMQLQQGQNAIDSLRRLQAEPVLALATVATEPQTLRSEALELLALGTPSHAVVVDVRRTPLLGACLADPEATAATAAWDAKALHRKCLAHFEVGPARWACAKLSAQLLAGGREQATDRTAVAAAAGVDLPRSLDSVAALGAEAQALAQVLAHQGRALQDASMQRVSKLESRAVAAVAEMEHRGMPFDSAAWRAVTAATLARWRRTRAELLTHLDMPKNTEVDHDAALLQALRSRGMAVKDAKRSTLSALPAPLGPLLERFKILGKQVHAYGDGYLDHVGIHGRLHATFEQIGASTGRMACHSPNLQAMVKGTEHRACFHPGAQRRLVVADYAACELRILAQISRDPVFVEAFAKGRDVHAQVAESIFNKPVSKTHHAHLRHIAKTVSFGLVYGMGPGALGRTLGMGVMEARGLMDRFFATFPRIRGALQTLSATAKERGWAQTGSGRRLYLDGPPYTDDTGLAERVGKNMPVQGTNADIIKLALARLRSALAATPEAYVVHCIHDEIVVECRADDANAVLATTRDMMVAAGRPVLPDVPLAVEARVLPHWGAEG